MPILQLVHNDILNNRIASLQSYGNEILRYPLVTFENLVIIYPKN